MTAQQVLVAGRFQPFHCEHARYLLAAVEGYDEMIVGITNPFRIGGEKGPAHRDGAAANPLRYELRERLVRAWAESNLKTPVKIVPLEFTAQWLTELLPADTVFATTTGESWAEEKALRARKSGLQSVVLDLGTRSISGTTIRQHIRADEPDWLPMVPIEVQAYQAEITDAVKALP